MTARKAGRKGPATPTKKAAATLGSAPRQWVPLVGFVEPAPQPQDGNTQGWARLRELVNAAVGDYVVQRSPDATMLAALLNDVLHECTHNSWLDEFDRKTRNAINAFRAAKQHEAQRVAQAWAREHFQNKRGEYVGKTEFAKDYVPLVLEQFGVSVSERNLRERWLKGLK